jgi:hypothetical protein
MVDSAERHAGGASQFLPMEIAHHSLFTAREKIDLLHKLKAEVTGEHANPDALGFDPDEIDQAIEEVKLGAQTGVGTETVLHGDN